MDEGHFPWQNKWGSQREKGREIAWELPENSWEYFWCKLGACKSTKC